MERYQWKVDKSDGPDACWLWTSTRKKYGYGGFWNGQTQVLAHRWGYEHLVGPIPEGHHVLHRCDNPPCNNPRHWFTGTDADNAADRDAKKRGGGWKIRGSGHREVIKVSEIQVREIRSRYADGHVSQLALAAEYGIHQTNVSNIIRRKTWQDVS